MSRQRQDRENKRKKLEKLMFLETVNPDLIHITSKHQNSFGVFKTVFTHNLFFLIKMTKTLRNMVEYVKQESNQKMSLSFQLFYFLLLLVLSVADPFYDNLIISRRTVPVLRTTN